MDVAHAVEIAAVRHADKLAFRDNKSELTFRQAYSQARILAEGMRRLGVRKGDRIALLVDNQVEYPVIEFAVAMLGAIRVPWLLTASVPDIAKYLVSADPAMVFCSERGAAKLASAIAASPTSPVVVHVDAKDADVCMASLSAHGKFLERREPVKPSDVHLLRYTGGTTGAPKGIFMDHESYVNAVIVNMLLNWPMTSRDIGLHVHALSHGAGMLMYPLWVAGGLSIFRPVFGLDPERFADDIERNQVSIAWIVPTVLTMMLESGVAERRDLSSMRQLIYGGAPIAPERLLEAIGVMGPCLSQVYGSSETPFGLTVLPPEDHVITGDPAVDSRLRSVGRSAINVEVGVFDEEGQPCSAGEQGEVMSRGRHNATGYWRDPELTARVFHESGWVRTGDIGYFDEDGFMFVVDRKDGMIITGGFNVWPSEVEKAMEADPRIAECVVFGVSDRKWGQAINAVVRLRSGGDAPAEVLHQIQAGLRHNLPAYKVPKRIHVASDPLPKNGVGKLDRSRIIRSYSSPGSVPGGRS